MEAISAKNYVSFIGIQTQCIEVELSHHFKCMCPGCDLNSQTSFLFLDSSEEIQPLNN